MNNQFIHILMFAPDYYDVEYVHIYRIKRPTNIHQYISTILIDELPEVYPEHIHHELLADEIREATYVRVQTFEPCDWKGDLTNI